MSVIPSIIPPQAFEIIRDRIGSILADELLNQSVLDANNPEIKATVWVERFVPFSHTEMPACNVMLSRGQLDGHSAIRTDGTYTYFIDFYTKAVTTAALQGDTVAIFRLHKLIGMARAILENPRYKTLGFVPPFIMFRRAGEITIADPGQQDAISSVMGRLVFNVKVTENTELIAPAIIAGYNTSVKLHETDLGYFYSKPI